MPTLHYYSAAVSVTASFFRMRDASRHDASAELPGRMCEMAVLPIVEKRVRVRFERRVTLSITLLNSLDLLEIGDGVAW